MHPVLRSLVERSGGVVTRRAAAEVVPAWVLRHAYRVGALRRVLPGVYVDASLIRPRAHESPKVHESTDAGAPVGGTAPTGVHAHPGAQVQARTVAARVDGGSAFRRLGCAHQRSAALVWADGRAALGSVTALAVWGVREQPDGEPVHLDTPRGTALQTRRHLVVHQRVDFTIGPPEVIVRSGVPVMRLERALVDAWPLLSPEDRPAPVIRAVNDRLTTPARIGSALTAVPRLSGRAQLRTLLDRLVAGCRSPLEIWGHDHVFTGPGMPAFRRQARVVVGRRTMYLDVYAERERVDFELDGATTHGDPHQREIDLRRDALLATVGILVVRFARHRLVHEPDAVRHEVCAILATRRDAADAGSGCLLRVR
ncbi:endonuclease domain-containing protein [Micromonospora sp. NBC_00421]|uniref:endonuclease domain-containing protein n=1 Tax=Micromonospora sp. NBC_00421 TaxID=2975976 RepID=UPI002E1FC50D